VCTLGQETIDSLLKPSAKILESSRIKIVLSDSDPPVPPATMIKLVEMPSKPPNVMDF
jgi:hypothetical protein